MVAWARVMAVTGQEWSDFEDIYEDLETKEEQMNQGQVCFFSVV